MSTESSLSLPELNDRAATIQDDFRQLVEQAAGASGANSEVRAYAHTSDALDLPENLPLLGFANSAAEPPVSGSKHDHGAA